LTQEFVKVLSITLGGPNEPIIHMKTHMYASLKVDEEAWIILRLRKTDAGEPRCNSVKEPHWRIIGAI
jgi:hypothetical protein